MSRQLTEKIDTLVGTLRDVRKVASALPEADEKTQYSISNSTILIYIPYNLHLLAEWQERLNGLGFTRADRYLANEYGVSVHHDYDKDSCTMIDKDKGLTITLWLCPGHPDATCRKGNFPVS